MNDRLLAIWLAVRRSGWFSPSRIGGIFPFPESGRGWAILTLFIATLALTAPFSGEAVMLARLALCVGYIGLGFVTYA